jgi:hypothetical protein
MDETFDVVYVVVDCFSERKEKKKERAEAQERVRTSPVMKGAVSNLWACDWGSVARAFPLRMFAPGRERVRRSEGGKCVCGACFVWLALSCTSNTAQIWELTGSFQRQSPHKGEGPRRRLAKSKGRCKGACG